MSDGTVLSDEQALALCRESHSGVWPCNLHPHVRAVERAVLEAVHPQCTDPIVGEHGHPLCGEVERLRARVAELERSASEFANQVLTLVAERDAARRELEEVRVQREMLVERLVSVRMTDWLKKRDGNFTNAESIEAERATREGVENWLRKDRAALDRAREGKP